MMKGGGRGGGWMVVEVSAWKRDRKGNGGWCGEGE